MKASDRYLKIVEWSDEDDCYVGTCPGLFLGGVHGKDQSKVYAELCEVVEETLELYREDKKPLPTPTNKEYSGKFMLRIDKDLHQLVAMRALQAGKSLNAYCHDLLRVVMNETSPGDSARDLMPRHKARRVFLPKGGSKAALLKNKARGRLAGSRK